MGIRLVSTALAQWPGLPDHARLALVAMAAQARDNATGRTPAATYYGGHDELARVLYGIEDVTDLHRRRIRRSMQALTDAGAIILVAPACRGRTAIYRIEQGSPNQDALI